MSTIIELFDKEQLENVLSKLVFPESRLVFLGYQNTFSKRRRRGISRFLKLVGDEREPEYIKVDRYDLEAVIEALEGVILHEPDCCFDLTGGGELVLLAMGILAERHSLPMFQIDPRTAELKPVFGEAPMPLPSPSLTVQGLVALHGGDVLRSEDETLPLTGKLRSDVNVLRTLCSEDKNFLNRVSAYLNTLASYTEFGEIAVSAPVCVSKDARELLEGLSEAGLIADLCISQTELSFSYFDLDVKHLLTKAGVTLELMVRMAAEEAGVFTDIRQGVVLDWDGIISDVPVAETRNEVDVILMRGVTPIFVSCKNGEVKKEALYELETVAVRFGGGYAKKVLACSSVAGTELAKAAFRRRAIDMNITLIEDAYSRTPAQLADAVGRLK